MNHALKTELPAQGTPHFASGWIWPIGRQLNRAFAAQNLMRGTLWSYPA